MSDQPEPPIPQSLGQAFMHLVWGIRPLWRNTILSVSGVCVVCFLLWNTLPEKAKAKLIDNLPFVRASSPPPLSPEQVSKRNYYVHLGDSFLNSRPDQALNFYRKALEIEPQNGEVKDKVRRLEEKQISGGAQ